MIGISAMGIYLPAYRLTKEVIEQTPHQKASGRERTVANYDEDALTMGVEASMECVENYERTWEQSLEGRAWEGLFFVSASSPYREKQVASILSSVLEMNRSAPVMDLSGNLRGGLTAIELGKTLLKEKSSGGNVLVVASEKRPTEPGSHEEQAFGDGASAVLLGQKNVLATLEAHAAVNVNFPHFWRRENDRYVHSGDTRFVENYGYLPSMGEAIRSLLDKTGLSASDIAKLVVSTPDPRLAQRLARSLDFNPETQLADIFFKSIGDTGSAQVFVSLENVLAKSRPGEMSIIAGYGDGAEAILLKTTENVLRMGAHRRVEAYLKRRRPLSKYSKYLHFRDIVGESSYDAFSSLALLWREEKQNLRLYGTRCQRCGVIHFPRRRVCDKCGAKDEMEDFKLSRRGRIYTYTNDYVYIDPDAPEGLAAIDLEDGGRFFGQLTDINPEDVKIGLDVELCFRKLHDGQEIPNYFWKARPVLGRE